MILIISNRKMAQIYVLYNVFYLNMSKMQLINN